MTTSTANEAETLERTRADTITTLAERYGAPIRLARKAIADGNSEAEFRAMIVDHQRKEQDKTAIFGIAPLDYAANDRSLSDRLADAILARVKPSAKIEADARQFVGLSMSEIARVALHARNESTHGVRQSELIGRALHTTSDFGMALSAVALRLVREGYSAAPSQIRRIARETTARDFRAKTSIQFREGGTLEKVNEHGEFKRGTFAETGETYRIDTFGKIFGLTRQALVNDDLDLLATVPSRLGGFASAFESTFLAKLLESPAKMADGVNFFHATHGNLAGTGTAISVASLGAARLALRRQKGIAGEVIAVEPKFLVVPPELETLAEQVLGDINAAKVEDTNPFAGRLELIVEPHLNNVQSWYLAAGAAETALEYAYLEGESGPQIETRQGFDVDGTEWKVRLDFGGGFVDHRGIFKNPGVAP
jgi:phage major head subunit gpT-like protein